MHLKVVFKMIHTLLLFGHILKFIMSFEVDAYRREVDEVIKDEDTKRKV